MATSRQLLAFSAGLLLLLQCSARSLSASSNTTSNGNSNQGQSQGNNCHSSSKSMSSKTISSDNSSVALHPAPSNCPYFDNVIIVMMENRAASLLQTAPCQVQSIQGILNDYSTATKYYGYTHDSEPNYIAITSGTNACTHSDNDLVYTQESIFDQLSQRGKSWKCYSQSLPYAGFNGSATPGDVYKRKHNPCPMYQSTVNEKNSNVDYNQFLTDLKNDKLPAFSFIDPDQCNDMHGAKGCNYKSDAQLIAAGDQWTQEFWNALWASPAWKNKKVFVAYVYDEDDYMSTALGCCASPMTPSVSAGNATCSWNEECDGGTLAPNCPEKFYTGDTVTNTVYGGGKTLAAFAYNQAKTTCTLDYPMNHLSVLKTIQHCWQLPLLGNAGYNNVPYLDQCVFT